MIPVVAFVVASAGRARGLLCGNGLNPRLLVCSFFWLSFFLVFFGLLSH